MTPTRICVLLVAAGAPWEAAALESLSRRSGIVVLKRCMDVTDLLAHAATGQAHVAVVPLDAQGLDTTALAQLARHQVGVVAVAPAAARGDALERARRLGGLRLIDDHRLDHLGEAVLAVGAAGQPPAGEVAPDADDADDGGRVVAVWGPTGAPGRTTVALGLAGELARRGADPLVIDLDPWGGAVAQHLGVFDEVSGLLACARATTTGELAGRFTGLQRRVAGLRVVTGLPRPDRWVEVPTGTVEQMVALARREGPVLLDTGFCLESDAAADYSGRPGRTGLTLAGLAEGDVVVAVGSADPVGLSRLARGLAELREVVPDVAVQVVVNRWRSRLGWTRADVAGLLEGFAEGPVHFLPEDGEAADRALLAGRTLAESGDSFLARAMAGLVDELVPEAPGVRRSLRRRTAGRGRRR